MAYSTDCEVRPYLVGNGTGLHAEWWTNFVATAGGEALALVATNASINFADTSVGGETENLLARWSGKLVAPFDGDFAFEAEATGVAYLWIDGVAVLYKGKATATKSLTGGEHDITVLWRHVSGAGSCRLCWGGCITHEVIPSTQFVPVPPREIPGEWVGARTFDVSEGNALFLGDVKANADGSIDMAHSGRDLSWGIIGYNFLWKPMKGDFSCVARIEYLSPMRSSSVAYKGGLMVRSALDAAAPFEACVIKVEGGHLKIGGKRCAARGNKPGDSGNYLDGAKGWSERVSDDDTGCWLRMRREGNTITYSYKKDNGGGWKTVYSFDVSPDVYGETVYVGLTSTSYVGYDYSRTPTYDWRFSNARVRPISGTVFTLR
jgi:hypothetical protein